MPKKEIDLNQPLPGWTQEFPIIVQAASKRSGGSKDGAFIYADFRRSILKTAGVDVPVKEKRAFALKAARLLYGKLAE